MRRFDGDADLPERKSRVPWSRRPQFQLAIAASLVLAVGLPATWIAVRDHGPLPGSVTPVPEPAAHYDMSPAPVTSGPQRQSRSVPVQPKEASPVALQAPQPQISVTNSPPAAAPIAERESSEDRDAMVAAAPPPPPPPPPPAPSLAQKSAEQGNELVVTGSRIRESNLADMSAFNSLPKRAEPPNRAYERFLDELQSAVRADDRGAVIRLIRFPLRVNANGKSRLYRDPQSVRVDYDLIFTGRVTEAILAQRADRLFARDRGRMIGDGEVWFARTCANQGCSSLGPVRISAINP